MRLYQTNVDKTWNEKMQFEHLSVFGYNRGDLDCT
jgi:hypothetical protein